MKLAYAVRGEGAPVVLLHGFTGSADTWTPYREHTRGLRAIAVDLPGHGRSPVVRGASFADVADAVVAVLDDLGVDRAAWLGYSMGGRVALQVAARHAARVDALVVESASPGLRSAEERAQRLAADEALAQTIERGGLAPFVERWAAQPLFASQQRLPADVLARERDARLANTAEGIAAGLRVMSVGRQPSLWEALPGLTMRTLVIVGEDDAKYVSLGRSIAAAVPRAVLRVTPGAGHTVHLERPAAFWAEVRSFLGDEAP